jgi:hypothetical protein
VWRRRWWACGIGQQREVKIRSDLGWAGLGQAGLILKFILFCKPKISTVRCYGKNLVLSNIFMTCPKISYTVYIV